MHKKSSCHFVNESDAEAAFKEAYYGEHRRGPKVQTFEEMMRGYIGAQFSKSTNCGTNALHIALLGIGVGAGDEVIIPSYVCQSVMDAVNYTGARLRFADVNRDIDNKGFNVSADTIERQMNIRTKRNLFFQAG